MDARAWRLSNPVPFPGVPDALTNDRFGDRRSQYLEPNVIDLYGQLRVLAIGSEARSGLAPDVPTLAEEGMTGFDVDLWYGLLAPAATPPEIVARYNTAVNEILATPRVKEALEKQGLAAVGGAPERLRDLLAADLARWARVVKDAGITAE